METTQLDKAENREESLEQAYQRLKPRKKGLWWKISLLMLAVLLAAAAAAGVTVWHLNEFTLTLTIQGDPEVQIEYAADFIDPGAQSQFWGTLLLREPETVAVTVTGSVDTGTLGDYTLVYAAQRTVDYFFGELVLQQTCSRTVRVVDTVAPVLELTDTDGYTLPGQEYVEEGYLAQDNHDGDLTNRVTSVIQNGKVYYSVTDSSGNETTAVREIVYDDPIPPELTLQGDTEITLVRGNAYVEPGYSALDNCDGDLTDAVTVTGAVDIQKVGTYELTYSVTDGYGNAVTATRTVIIRATPALPDMPLGDFATPAEPAEKVIYLTFDDGPCAGTEWLLDILAKYDAKATFFVVDIGYLHLLPRMVEEGHTVAMHTDSHNYGKIYDNEAAYFADLKAIQDKIYQQTGQICTMFRFPGGSSNMVSSYYNEGIMTRLTAMVKEMGYRYFDWNVDSRDASTATTAEEVYTNVTNAMYGRDYAVVLQHDVKPYSIEAVEKILQWGIAHGYSFRALTTSGPVCEHNVNN